MNDAARAHWLAARSFDELCDLARRFFEGELESFPGWGAPDLDEESDELLPTLVACARGGFLTTASQPGRPSAPGHDGRPWTQRAFLAGFCGKARAGTLAEAARENGLLIWEEVDVAPDPGTGCPVGLRDGEPYLWAGEAARAVELELFEGEIGQDAYRELTGKRFLWLVDPVWGRRDLLVQALGGAQS